MMGGVFVRCRCMELAVCFDLGHGVNDDVVVGAFVVLMLCSVCCTGVWSLLDGELSTWLRYSMRYV